MLIITGRTNNILNLANLMPQIETGQFNLTHPITFDPFTFEQYTLPAHMGGFTVSDIGVVEKIEAMSMTYFLDATEDWQAEIGDRWERKFLSALQEAESDLPDIKISKFVSNTPAWEMEAAKDSVTPNLLINVTIMVLFCLIAASMSDVVRSKPFIGFIGLFTAINATIAGFGFACYLGVEFIALCYAAPFLLLGIGIDDTFVMLSAWLRSPAHASVPERMGHCYSDAAVSVTVTSITNILSFYAGVITPFPCVRIFCLYTGTAVVFIYIWQLSFFGACLAMAGYREKRNKSFFNLTATPKSQSLNRGLIYRLFLTGGINPADPYNPLDNKDHAGMVFLRDKLGYALNLKWVKSLVLIVFTAYIVVAIWGITNIKEGLDKRNIVKFDSYSIDFYNEDDKYFNEYRYPINVMLTGGDIFYSEKRTQDRIEKLMQTFENSSYIAETMSQSWLRDFLSFVERNKGYYTDIDLSIQTENDFVNTLKNSYLSDPASPFNLDVNFDDNGKRIVSSRFLLMGLFINDSIKESEMVRELRKICQEFSTDDFQVNKIAMSIRVCWADILISGDGLPSLLHIHRSVFGNKAANNPVSSSHGWLHDGRQFRHDPQPHLLPLGGLLNHEHRGGCPGLHDLVGGQPGRRGPDQPDHVHRVQRGLLCPHLLPLHVCGGQVSRQEDLRQPLCPWTAHHSGSHQHHSRCHWTCLRSQLSLHHLLQDDIPGHPPGRPSRSRPPACPPLPVRPRVLREEELRPEHPLHSLHHRLPPLLQAALLLHSQPRLWYSRRVS